MLYSLDNALYLDEKKINKSCIPWRMDYHLHFSNNMKITAIFILIYTSSFFIIICILFKISIVLYLGVYHCTICVDFFLDPVKLIFIIPLALLTCAEFIFSFMFIAFFLPINIFYLITNIVHGFFIPEFITKKCRCVTTFIWQFLVHSFYCVLSD